MTHPRQFLRDIYDELGADQHAALASFTPPRDASLEAPPHLTQHNATSSTVPAVHAGTGRACRP